MYCSTFDNDGQAKLEDIFSKTGLYSITRKSVGGGYQGFSYCGHEEWVTFYYIINKNTESREYQDTKNYLCQDNYSILNDNWLYKIIEHQSKYFIVCIKIYERRNEI